MRTMRVACERYPLRAPFVISRLDPIVDAEVVVVTLAEGGVAGHGEAERSELFEPELDDTLAAIERARPAIEAGADRAELRRLLPAGCARNAIDCALLDLEAKLAGRPAWDIIGLTRAPGPLVTAFTLSLDSPEAMTAAARAEAERPLLKLKLGSADGRDPERVAAVRAAAPEARLLVDANTGWSRAQLIDYLPAMRALGVEMIEQPLPVGAEAELDGVARLVPLAADESCTDMSSLPRLIGRFDLVNIKLDKAGGLTEALELARAATAAGLAVMIGCNVGTSLSMAPAMLIGQQARYVDLDGPLLLSRDRAQGLSYRDQLVHPASPALWG